MRRDAIVEVIEVRTITVADVPQVVADREEQTPIERTSRPSPVQA